MIAPFMSNQTWAFNPRAPEGHKFTNLGLPLSIYDFAFMTRSRKPALMVVGGEDGFAPPLGVAGLRELLPSSARLRVLNGADHFFTGQLDQVEALIADFLKVWMPEGGGK